MSRELKIGGVYEHFKREFCTIDRGENNYRYLVLGVARHANTEEQLVIYQALYSPYQTYARPIEEFLSDVDTKKYPEVERQYRMTLIYDRGNYCD